MTMAHGINLAMATDHTSEFPFADCFRLSRPWVSQLPDKPWGTGPPIRYAANGGILLEGGGHIATTLMNWSASCPPGKYNFSCSGAGRVEMQVNKPGSVAIPLAAPGGVIFDVPPGSAGITLRVTESSPADPLRGFRCVMPGATAADLFHPDYVERLRGFSVIRCMDWQATNGNPIVSWSHRTTPQSPRQLPVCIEHCIDLANILKADLWLCVPHAADRNYIDSMARLVRDRLDPGRKLYLEYSNETWNDQFPQAKYCQAKGVELGLAANVYEAGHRYTARRSVEIFSIFAEHLTFDRMVRVMPTQAGNPWVSETRLQHDEAWKVCDALSPAPYFGHDAKGTTVDEVLAACATHVEAIAKQTAANKAVVDKYGLRLVAYEAGQHLAAPNDPALTDIFIAANRDPRMGDLYARYADVLEAGGYDLTCWYNSAGAPTKWGSWGLCEHQHQPIEQAPKMRAVRARLGRPEPRPAHKPTPEPPPAPKPSQPKPWPKPRPAPVEPAPAPPAPPTPKPPAATPVVVIPVQPVDQPEKAMTPAQRRREWKRLEQQRLRDRRNARELAEKAYRREKARRDKLEKDEELARLRRERKKLRRGEEPEKLKRLRDK